MKSKILVLGLTLGLVMSLLATGCTSPAPPATAEPVVLKQSCFAPPGHIYTGWAEEFGSRVAEATGNRVTVEVYPGQALCPAKEELTACHTGTIDMTYVPVTYLVGMVPLLNYAALPWCSPPTPESAAKASLEMDPILRKALEEYNVHLVWMQFLPGNMGLSTKKEVRTPEDLKGMKMRTSGGLADKLAVSWGAAPVSVPSPEMYTALQKGTIDAAMVTLPSVKGYRMVEVAPYYTDIAMGLNGLLAVVNKDKWNLISKADQEAITDLVPDWLVWLPAEGIEENEKARAEWPDLGVNRYAPTPAEIELWKQGAKPLWEEYAESSPEAKKIADILVKHGAGVK